MRSSVICSDANLPRVEYEDIVSGAGRLNKDIYAKQSSKSGIAFHRGDVLYGKLRPYLQNWLLPTFDGLAVGDFWVLQPQNADSSFLYRLIQSRQHTLRHSTTLSPFISVMLKKRGIAPENEAIPLIFIHTPLRFQPF